MTPDELISMVRSGDVEGAIKRYIAVVQGGTLESLLVQAMQLGLDDVSEPLLLALLREQPEHAVAHEILGQLYLRQEKFAEALPHFQTATTISPDRTLSHNGTCTCAYALGDIEVLRSALYHAQKHIPEGQHLSFQYGLSPLTKYLEERDGELAHFWQAEISRELERRSNNRDTLEAPSLNNRANRSVNSDPESVVAQTSTATEIGQDGACLVGEVAANSASAEYRFEYGCSPDDLSEHTEWQSMPGPLTARLVTAPQLSPLNFLLYAGQFKWFPSSEGDCILGDWPFGKDPNHISGAGFIELLCGQWHNSCQPDGFREIFPWESSDLRDAEYRMQLRIDDFDSKGFMHCVGVGNVDSYWMLTDSPVDLSNVPPDGHLEISVRLKDDATKWSVAGNNPDEQGNAERYSYGPLAKVLGENVGNIVFVAPFGDWRDTPTGKVGIQKTDLTYRDRNVLHSANGALLIETPSSTSCSPTNLSNGRRGEFSDAWYHLGLIEEPLRFTWQLAHPVAVATIVFHQDAVLPTKRCRITVGAESGQAHSWDFELPVDDLAILSSPTTVVRLPGTEKFNHISIEFIEGGKPEGLGLAALEIFANDFVPPPTREPVTVSTDVGSLTPGAAVYYRIQARTNGDIVSGDTKEIQLPYDDQPKIHDIYLHSSDEHNAVFSVRGNAMGHRTILQWRLDDGPWNNISMGWEKTSVHRYIKVRDIEAGEHRLTVRLEATAKGDEEKTVMFSLK